MNVGGADVGSAVLPLLKLITLALFGLLLVHPRFKIVPKDTFKLLSRLVFSLFLPCLIFTHLGPTITLKVIPKWWFIPVNVFVSTGIGCILGCLVTIICRTPPRFIRFTIIMTAFGNTEYNGERGDIDQSDYEEEEAQTEIIEEEEVVEVVQSSDLSTTLLIEAEWPGIEDKATELCKTPFIARLFNSISGLSETKIPEFDLVHEDNKLKSIRCLAEPRVVKKVRIAASKTPFHHIFQPPVIASLLAILAGIISPVKYLLFGGDAVLSVITDSLDIIAEAMVPSTMLVLGGMLSEGPTKSNLGTPTIVGIIVARLFVLPPIGIGVVTLAEKWNLLIEGDEVYRFVIWLQYTTPSAILLGAIASLRGYGVREASALLFWQHVVALFSISFYLILYFHYFI